MPANTTIALSESAELLQQAMESPRGIAIECESEAEATHLRFRLYSARKAQRIEHRRVFPPEHPQHNRSYWESLIIKIDGTTVSIIPGEKITMKVREL